MTLYQIKNIETLLDWLKTCPLEYHISSMQGNHVHLKISIPFCNIPENKS